MKIKRALNYTAIVFFSFSMLLILLYSFLIGFNRATYDEHEERKAEHQKTIREIIEQRLEDKE